MKAPKGFTIVPIEYRMTHEYPRGCRVMWFNESKWNITNGWMISHGNGLWYDKSVTWAIESIAVNPTKDYSETVLRRIEKGIRRLEKMWGPSSPKCFVSLEDVRETCKTIRSDIKKRKGNK